MKLIIFASVALAAVVGLVFADEFNFGNNFDDGYGGGYGYGLGSLSLGSLGGGYGVGSLGGGYGHGSSFGSGYGQAAYIPVPVGRGGSGSSGSSGLSGLCKYPSNVLGEISTLMNISVYYLLHYKSYVNLLNI